MSAPVSKSRARRALVIFNPTAGWRRRRRFEATVRRMRGLGCEVAIRETGGPGDAERLAWEGVAGALTNGAYDVVVAAGGDGTINEVIGGLSDDDVPLGILPLGTANVLAGEIGLKTSPRQLAEVLARGIARPVYLGVANGRRFAVMAGVGFDAHVVRDVSLTLKRWTGKLAYVWQCLVQLVRLEPIRYRVTISGQTHEAASVIVANGHYYGGRFVCAPEARLDAPDLQVVLFERAGRWNALRYLWGIVTGRLRDFSDVRIISAEALVIDGPEGDPVQGDGDIIARLPVQISLARRTLPLLQPDGSAETAATVPPR